jgi:mercuric ion transport protein
MAMKERNLVGAGVLAVLLGICCAAPLLVVAIGGVGLTAWLANACHILILALILGVGVIAAATWKKRPLSREDRPTRKY